MKKIGFIGAYDKIDMIMYVAKILTVCGKRVLIVDSTINQKAKYIIPAINPTATYITDFEEMDFAMGFKNLEQIGQYLQVTEEEMPYDIILIDIDNPYNLEGFDLNTTEKNYFVTGFDLFSIKRGIQIISLIKSPVKFSKILFSQNISKDENDYLEYISSGCKIIWDENRVYFPIENGDLTVIAENQRSAKINFKKLSQYYKDALLVLANDIDGDIGENQIRRAIKILEGTKNNKF